MDTEITARTTISGIVNGQTMKGHVLASFNTDGGGRSSCEFTALPETFNPGTFGNQT
jgi:hypothetical protein